MDYIQRHFNWDMNIDMVAIISHYIPVNDQLANPTAHRDQFSLATSRVALLNEGSFCRNRHD